MESTAKWRCVSGPQAAVFLSHSGQEKPFTEQLWQDLKRVKQRSFFDQNSDSLPKAEKFGPEIIEAAGKCRLGVVVVSEGYLTSKWPMVELRAFVESKKKLLPLFLKLSPSDLKQPEVETRWKPAWRKLVKEGVVEEEVVDLWSEAVKELRSSNGLEYGKFANSEYKYRGAVVDEICKLLPPVLEWDVDHILGYERLCEATSSMFNGEVDGGNNKYLGLYGMAGVGKTTLCKAMCRYFQGEFGGRVLHVELGSDQANDRLARVKQVVQQLAGFHRSISESIMNEEQGWKCLKDGLRNQLPVFLAIDNVGDPEDSREEARRYLTAISLPSGSKVMVTARSQEIVESVLDFVQGAEYCNKPMPRLEWQEAAMLFLSKAAPNVKSVSSLNPEEREVVTRCLSECQFADNGYPSRQFHPLVLRALGTYFFDLDKGALNVEKWRGEMNSRNKLQRCREAKKVNDMLGLNYHSLSDQVKRVFLDSALHSHDLHWRILSWWANEIPRRSELDMWVAWLSDVHEVSPSDARMMVKELQRLSLLEVSSSKVLVHDLYKEFARVLVETKKSKEWEWWMSRSEEKIIQGSNNVMRLGRNRNDETSLIGRPPEKPVQEWRGLVFLHLFDCDDAGPVLELAGLKNLRVLFVKNCDKVKRIDCSCDDNGDQGDRCYNNKPTSWGCMSELVGVRVECSNRASLEDLPFLKHCPNLQSLEISISHDDIEPVYPAESEAIDFGYLKRLRTLRICGGRAMLGYDTGAFIRWLLAAFQLEDLTVFQYRSYEENWNGDDGRVYTIDLSEVGRLPSRLSVLSLRLPRRIEEVKGLHLLSELTTLDLDFSEGLRRLQPDLRMLSKLKWIYLDGCCNLEAHPSLEPGVQFMIADEPFGLTVMDRTGVPLSTCIDGEDDAEPHPSYYKVKSLVWIWRNTVRSVALEDRDSEVMVVSNDFYTIAPEECYKSKVKLLSYQPDEKMKRREDLRDESMKVIPFFLGSALVLVFGMSDTLMLCHGEGFNNCIVRVRNAVFLIVLVWALDVICIWKSVARFRLVDEDFSEECQARWNDFQESVRRAIIPRKYSPLRGFEIADIKEKKLDLTLRWHSFLGIGVMMIISLYTDFYVRMTFFSDHLSIRRLGSMYEAAELMLQVVAHLRKMVGSEGLVGAQIVDIACERDTDVSLGTLEYVHKHRTAVLLECAVVSGAIVGGASEDEISRLSEYAFSVGLPFQVVDDILDVTKSSAELGKTGGKDVLAGKATYPKLLGLAKSKEYAGELKRKAKEQLSVFDQEKAAPLIGLADYIADRQN